MITAEGVENETQAAMLKEWGCDQVQGYYSRKPETDASEDTEADGKPLNRPLDIDPVLTKHLPVDIAI